MASEPATISLETVRSTKDYKFRNKGKVYDVESAREVQKFANILWSLVQPYNSGFNNPSLFVSGCIEVHFAQVS